MSATAFANIATDTFALLISLILITAVLIDKNVRTSMNVIFTLLLVSNSLSLSGDMLDWIFAGNTELHALILIRIGNFLIFAFLCCTEALFGQYVHLILSEHGITGRGWLYAIYSVCGFGLLVLIISQWTGLLYTIGGNNYYVRGPLYWLPYVIAIFVAVEVSALLIIHRKKLGRKTTVTLLLYYLLPSLTLPIQFIYPSIMLVYAATAVSLLIVYLMIQVDRGRQLMERELELTNAREEIMLSQIKPHFLHNTLVVIKQLCDIDPSLAKNAVTEFSTYLRGNLDSLNQKGPIPFERELQHAENYLALEKKRFGDKLQIRYDIGCTDFLLPALTLQPLAENAVRHGVTKLKGGGTVTISSKEEQERFVVTVEDNGSGFDPSSLPQDGRSHIGIENVRSRLAAICGGLLKIDSAPGHGTAAIITIPKDGGRS